MKIRSIVIDDIKASVDTIIELCNQIPEIEIIATANSVKEGIEKVNTFNPELLFLDIQLGSKSGFDLLDSCQGNYQQVIFISAYDNYVLESYNYSTLHYLLKPVCLEDLKRAVAKAIARNYQIDDILQQLSSLRSLLAEQKASPKIFLPNNNVWQSIEIENISFIEAKAMYCMIYLNGKELVVSKPLKYFEEILMPYTNFVRVHKSYIINLNYIQEVYRGLKPKVVLNSNIEVPISIHIKDKIFTLLGIKGID